MTPLVDVMLVVLLIIFIITIPVINHAVKLDLPQATNQPTDIKPPHVQVNIEADGTIMWDGARLPEAELGVRVAGIARRDPQPEIHLWADRMTPYENIAKVMAAAQSGGLSKIGFITQPKH